MQLVFRLALQSAGQPRMGVSPGRVSQVLSGGENLTLRTLVSLATALDGRFEVQFRPYKPSGDSYAGHGADAGEA